MRIKNQNWIQKLVKITKKICAFWLLQFAFGFGIMKSQNQTTEHTKGEHKNEIQCWH